MRALQLYTAANTGEHLCEFCNAPDLETAKAAAWRQCASGQVFRFVSNLANPVYVRASNRDTTLSVALETDAVLTGST